MSLTTQDLLARNAAYKPSHHPIPTFAQIAPPDGSKLNLPMIITCLDPRCIPEHFLSLTTLEALTLRNAGGNLAMALPNILALDHLVGISEIMVVKHTDCGTLAYTEEGVKGELVERAPGCKHEIEGMEVGSNSKSGLEAGLREEVKRVRGSQLVRGELKEKIRGFVYDLNDGGLTEVEV